MKRLPLISLLFLSACSTTPRLALQPQQQQPGNNPEAVRYPEVVRAYQIGRYADPNDGLVMHEQHVVYRVEENTRWDFHPGVICGGASQALPAPRDAAFSPAPVNDTILAEVNAQKLATARIMVEAKTLSAALAQFQAALQQTRTNLQETALLRAAVIEMKKRLDALETTRSAQPFSAPATNEPPGSSSP